MSSSAAASPEQTLQTLMCRRLVAFRDGLGPRLRDAFDELATRVDLLRPDRGEAAPGYFFAPLALPVLQLPRWVFAAAARQGRPLPEAVVDDLVEAAATGYLHVRVQDDLLDEGIGSPPEVMLLAEAFFVRHQALLARVVGASEGFWELFERRWREYQEAMLLEQALWRAGRGYDAAAFDLVLRRSLPLVLPGAAALERAGLSERLPHLERFVDHLVRGHQLFHDLVDAEQDARRGNLTYLVQRFGGAEDLSQLRRRLLLEGGFDQVTSEAHSELEAAAAAAELALLDEAGEAIARRQDFMNQVRRDTYAALFDRLLADDSGKH